MKAMVFAAGLGTRLKPFTDYHPKALAEVCGKPMLGRVIEKLKDAGVDEIVVNVHHFADQIVEYIGKNDNFGITIHISDETDKLLDTGGGILAARDYFEGAEPFTVPLYRSNTTLSGLPSRRPLPRSPTYSRTVS